MPFVCPLSVYPSLVLDPSPFAAVQVSWDGSLCCTVGADKAAKIFDIATFDMIAMLRLSFVPGSFSCLLYVYLISTPCQPHFVTSSPSHQTYLVTGPILGPAPLVARMRSDSLLFMLQCCASAWYQVSCFSAGSLLLFGHNCLAFQDDVSHGSFPLLCLFSPCRLSSAGCMEWVPSSLSTQFLAFKMTLFTAFCFFFLPTSFDRACGVGVAAGGGQGEARHLRR